MPASGPHPAGLAWISQVSGTRAESGPCPPRLPGYATSQREKIAADARSALLAVDGIVRGAGPAGPSPSKPMPATATDKAGVGQLADARKSRRRSVDRRDKRQGRVGKSTVAVNLACCPGPAGPEGGTFWS